MYACELPPASTPLRAAFQILSAAFGSQPLPQSRTAIIWHLYKFYQVETDPHATWLHIDNLAKVSIFLAREVAPDPNDDDWIVQTAYALDFPEKVKAYMEASGMSTPEINWAERSVVPPTPEEARASVAYYNAHMKYKSAVGINNALNEQKQQEVQLQRKLGSWALITVTTQLVITNVIMVAYFVLQFIYAQTVPSQVLIAWMTTCFAEVLGILWVIARSLYPRRDNAANDKLQTIPQINDELS